MGRIDVLAVGELNPDLILSGITAPAPRLGTEQEFDRAHLTLGSSTAITCVLMQRLGLATALSAYVGDDEHGRFCRSALEVEGVDVALVRTQRRHATGLTVCLPYPSDRLLLTAPGAMVLNPADAIGAAALRSVRHVHVGSYFLQHALRPAVAPLFAAARALGATTSLDTGWDPQERWLDDDLRAALAHTSVLFPNAMEFAQLAGTSDVERGIEALIDQGVSTVVLKLGSKGAAHGDADGVCSRSGFFTTPADTTGAGDAFNAGYLAGMLAGGGVDARLAIANACGALTVAAVGGTGGVHDMDQVRAFIAAQMADATP